MLARRVLLTLLLTLTGTSLHADFDAEVTKAPGFDSGIGAVALVTVSCHESVDCAEVEDRAAADLGTRGLRFRVIPPDSVRRALFERGSTSMTDDVRQAVLDEVGADAVLEISIPFGNRGDGFGGRRRSEVRVEVRLVTRGGELRLSGRGSGRPKNVVSGTERVAGNVLERIFDEAFGGS